MHEVTKVLKVYQYDELSEKAKGKAYQNWYEYADPDVWDSDYRAVMKRFEEVFNCKIDNWSVGNSSSDHSFRVHCLAGSGYLPEEAYDAMDLRRRVRLSKYIMARFSHFYKVDPRQNDGCPFTGFCGDYSINEVLKKVFSFETLYDTYHAFLADALSQFFADWAEDRGYQVSEEAFKEGAGEKEYLENGEIFTE